MKMRIKTVSSALLFFLLWLPAVPSESLPGTRVLAAEKAPLAPQEYHKKINDAVLNLLKKKHYLKVSLDDDMSSKIFYRYFNELDPGHSFFYNSDVQGYELVYRFDLDDKLAKNDLGPVFKIFNRYQERVVEQLSALIAEVEKGQKTTSARCSRFSTGTRNGWWSNFPP
jgi:hypothetical protein